MKTPSAADVFTARQNSTETLKAIHRDLRKNRLSSKRGTWERNRLEIISEELRNRGQLL